MRSALWYSMAVAVAALTAGFPGSSHAICWIDRIERARTGIKVYFSSQRSVQIVRPGKPPLDVIADQAAPEQPASDKSPARVKWVEGVPGDVFRSHNFSHDGCRMTVATQGDKLGLWAEAWMGIPGSPPDTVAKFIAAQ